MKLAEIIKSYRAVNGLSMDEFSARSGLSKSYISMIENNKNARDGKPISPTLVSLRKIAKAMQIDIDELLVMMDSDENINLTSEEQSSCLREDEKALLIAFNQLNADGRDEAVRRITEMTELSRYVKDTESHPEKAM